MANGTEGKVTLLKHDEKYRRIFVEVASARVCQMNLERILKLVIMSFGEIRDQENTITVKWCLILQN